MKSKINSVGIGVLLLWCAGVFSQERDEDNVHLEEIVVTGSVAVQTGGVQDVNYMREEVSDGEIPLPEDFSIEGLFSEYSLDIPSNKKCRQLLCLVGESAPTKLITQHNVSTMTAISFSSNAVAADFDNTALNLVAVVDRSGSMGGEPMVYVKAALHALVNQLGEKDKLAIVLYGSDAELWLDSISVSEENKHSILNAIDRIEIVGGTNLEGGLILGYATAKKAQRRFNGSSRVFLFTDERPNIGDTSANGFIQQAISASKAGIGLTTIGVGNHFGVELAASVGSVRGGNVYFIRNKKEAARILEEEFHAMVSELAFDLDLIIEPQQGFRISGVYGTPKEFLSWKADGKIQLHIPTVFASSKQGAIFVNMEAIDDDHLPASVNSNPKVKLSLSYIEPNGHRRFEDRLEVKPSTGEPSPGLQLGTLLINEYLVLKKVAQAYHQEGDHEQTYWLMKSLQHEFINKVSLVPQKEQQLANKLLTTVANAAGYGNENLDRDE